MIKEIQLRIKLKEEKINNILIKFTGHRLINNNKIDYFLKNNAFQFVEMVKQMKFDHELIEFFNESKSQLLQELFVAIKLNFKKNGFFVEFGVWPKRLFPLHNQHPECGPKQPSNCLKHL